MHFHKYTSTPAPPLKITDFDDGALWNIRICHVCVVWSKNSLCLYWCSYVNQNIFVFEVHFTTVTDKNRSPKNFWEMLGWASYLISHCQQKPSEGDPIRMQWNNVKLYQSSCPLYTTVLLEYCMDCRENVKASALWHHDWRHFINPLQRTRSKSMMTRWLKETHS